MKASKLTFGAPITGWPVAFESIDGLFSTLLISKYEAITVYLHPQTPKIIHQKHEAQYVMEYRVYQSKDYRREISVATFKYRWNVARLLSEYLVEWADYTEYLVPVTLVTATLTKVDAQETDRTKLTGSVVINKLGTEYLGAVSLIVNRFGAILFGDLTFDDVQPDFWETRRVGCEGYIHLEHTPEEFIELQLGTGITINFESGISAFRLYELGNAPIEGPDFDNSFDNSFNI